MSYFIGLFMNAMLAGVCIGIGGCAYLSTDNAVIGAFLFSIGLIMVCSFKLKLYTGKVPYIKPRLSALRSMITIIFGNIVGAFIVGTLFASARPELVGKATAMCFMKLEEGYGSVIMRAIMCNILIFIAVHTWKDEKLESTVRLIVVSMCVMVFIVCGFEHCIADVFYFTAGQMFDLNTLLFLILTVIFNGIGGIAAYRLLCFVKWMEEGAR